VKFGGKECIWLNKEKCESGKDKTMKLWTLELIDLAMPFDRKGKHNDWGKATELREQCESELIAGCTKEELDMLVTVKMSSVDGYEKVEPILEKKNEKKEMTVESLFEDLYEGNIDEETLRLGLKDIVKAEREKEGATEADAKALSEKIAQQSKLLNEKLDEAFGKVENEIDSLQFGGK